MIDVLTAMARQEAVEGRSVALLTWRVVGGTLGALGRGIVPMLILATVFFGPLLLWGATFANWLERRLPSLPPWLSHQALPIALTALFQGTIVIVVLRLLARRGPRLWVAPGWRTILHAWRSSLAIAGSIVMLSLLAIATGSALVFVAELILVVILGCVFYVTVPAAAIERLGVLKALRRSACLTRGVRMRIFMLYLIGIVFVMVVQVAAALATGRHWTDGFSPQDAALEGIRTTALYLWHAIASVVTYQILVREREGMGVRDLLAVFD